MPSQLTSTILMIRPANFGFNPETADNNTFQKNDPAHSINTIKEKAIQEFDTFVEKLKDKGIDVQVFEDTTVPVKTDAVFPNNWISFHEDGLLITYPMFSPNRRLERREDIIESFSKNYQIKNHVRLEKWESTPQFLEGTGSIIIDRVNQIAYASLSIRTDEKLFEDYCQFMKYKKVIFHSVDVNGIPIYHTNVMMTLGVDFVVICMDSIPNLQEQEQLKELFKATNKKIISITLDQMAHFAGNMLQLKNTEEETFLVMSTQAFTSLTAQQIQELELHTNILHSDLSIIETYGGGSARCMIAEVFS